MLFQTWRELTTFVIRLLAFAATLAVMGACFLPWVRLDGTGQARSGIELVTVVLSPTISYLYAVSPLQTGVLVACSALAIASAVIVMSRYGRRQTALLATCIVLVASLLVTYATPDLVAGEGAKAHAGALAVITISAVLLLHQGLIKLRKRLYVKRKFPGLYATLSVITGSGYYRWQHGRKGWLL